VSVRHPRPLLGLVLVSIVAPGLAFAAGQEQPLVHRTAGRSALSLPGGPVIYETTATIQESRLIHVPGTPVRAVTWNETGPDGASTAFYVVALDGQRFSRPLRASHELDLQYLRFDPVAGEPLIDAAWAADAATRVYIVQFFTQPLEAYQDALRGLGATIHRFLPNQALVVSMSQEAVQKAAQLEFVRWVGRFHPAYRVDAGIWADWLSGAPLEEPRTYSVEVLERGLGAQEALRPEIEALGGEVINVSPDGFRMTVALTAEGIWRLARRNEVNHIDPWGPGGPDMDLVRQMGGAVPTLSDLGFTGQGVRGEIFDTEVQKLHPAWNGQQPLYNGPDGFGSAHGTSCYGINFATGAGMAQATGLLPNREQGIFNYFGNSTQHGGPTTRLDQNKKATDPNGPFWSSYQTSSVGSTVTTTYSSISAETDDYLFLVDYLSTQSQSNQSSQASRPQAWAKNIVSVGGVFTNNTVTHADDTVSLSSFGPASDTRVKPDLVHAYDSVYTTQAGSSYTEFCCTSAATPIVAGHFGLLLQMWHEGVWSGHGGKASVFFSRPKSMTAKALMINTAYRYPLTQGGLDRDRQGWGMPDVGKMYVQADRTYVVDQTHLLAPLGVNAYHIGVPPGTPELAVTLAYIDPMGNPNVQSQHRVNDLSLRVTAPGGIPSYWGNHGLMTSNFSTPGGSPDTKNTVENVFIENPPAGAWTIEIFGDEIIQDSHLATPGLDADYALVVRGKAPVPIGCPGDLNLDGMVDQMDLGLFLSCYGKLLGQTGYLFMADMFPDGVIDQSDLGIMLAGYGDACP
jgi:serine protease AprX